MAFQTLYDYQKQYLATMPNRAIFAADTGVGKTAMSLVHYINNSYPKPLLILAPASKVRTQDWERDVAEVFSAHNIPEPEYYVYSYEKFSRNPSLVQRKNGAETIWQKFAPAFNGGRQYAVIADEVHKAKNPQSGIGKALWWTASEANFFVGLSATALPNGWIDFANYMKIFGLVKNITSFKQRYCNYETFKGFPELKNYWREEELTKYWNSVSRRLTKDQALDLPARTFTGVNFKRTTAYTKMIVERKNLQGDLLDNPSALAHALRQTLTSEKVNYLSDLIDGTDENIVIFYNYVSEREAIMDMLSKKHSNRPLFRQDGEKHELPTKDQWADVKRSITLAHYKSGSTGIEITYATQVVYFSPTYSYAEYIQSIGRVYRNGQTKHTTFYNFRTRNTIEVSIYNALKNKGDFQVNQWQVD